GSCKPKKKQAPCFLRRRHLRRLNVCKRDTSKTYRRRRHVRRLPKKRRRRC
nr:scyliorhinine Z1 [Scyliorhinus canicula]